MFTMMKLTVANTCQEAYDLAQKRGARYLGGLMWLKLGDGVIREGIDLCGLGLDTIELIDHPDLGESVRIGAMVTLGAFERDDLVSRVLQGANKDCVDGIVGVQFRNGATIGGSVAMKAGFSDVCNLLLTAGASVELQGAGLLAMEDFIKGDYRNDLVKYIYLRKTNEKYFFKNYRLDSGDLPSANVCLDVCADGTSARCSIGARPSLATCKKLEEKEWSELYECRTREELRNQFEELIAEISFSSNLKASGDYRRNLAIKLLADVYSQWKESI